MSRLQFPFSDEPSSYTNANGTFIRMERTNERTNERMNLSVVSVRVRSFLYPFRRARRPSRASSVARRVMPSRRRRDRHSGRFKRGSDENRTRAASASAEVPRRRFFTRPCVFFIPGGWVCVRFGVYVFSVCARSTQERTNGARVKDGRMDDWCERKGLIRKVTTTDACGMNLYSSVM